MLRGLTSKTSAIMVAKGIGSLQPLRILQLLKDGSMNSCRGKSNSRNKGVVMDRKGCTHCGNKKHTQDTCFKLDGYLEWWHDLKAKKSKEIVVNCNNESINPTSDQGNQNVVLLSYKHSKEEGWLVDSRATYHMTYCSNDFTNSKANPHY
ncbi:hypothetical protein CR513_24409, partial [Mucuna pruriens]